MSITDPMALDSKRRHLETVRRVVIVCLLSLVGNAFAACREESRVLAQVLATTSGMVQTSGVRFARASAYITAGCLDKALSELKHSDAALVQEGWNNADLQTRKRSGDALRTYIGALQKLALGQRQSAVNELLSLLETSRSSDVMWRTTMTLGELLSQQSKPDEWASFGHHLAVLAGSNMRMWQVDLFRGLKDVRDGNGDAAVATVGDELARELDPQRYFALNVVLIDLLVADKRFANARVWCNWSDSRIGEGLFDIELRLRYLKACQAAWDAAPTAASAAAANAKRIFEEAVRKFESEQ